ncbi:uncharacterized protein LOC18421801 isoform X2 [Amborella trichopoda]|uniref:uncharacterized protein LOC18421801 isoform X2 n=1 Tax=Amborella trichopoda TaxID=13333 RepID=UPI0009BDAE6F|nr:uncharacterized protein LOC18421801 isoform X2 [Amborella trichopoda]|eukprot:XP_020518434.1 uncharacterized protein LOC18421801 isoform X2 [Amborella trichopoda]
MADPDSIRILFSDTTTDMLVNELSVIIFPCTEEVSYIISLRNNGQTLRERGANEIFTEPLISEQFSMKMGKSLEKWRLIWPFFFIFFLHTAAIFLFTRGFLLTRTELSSTSSCSDLSSSPCSSDSFIDPSTNKTLHCWTKPAIDRVIIIIIDALRFDFLAPSAFFEEAKPWMDRLRVLQDLAYENGSSAKIFKAISDPPTTTLQRLKGLTTGGLPTFIDVGNSFGAPAIIEDNLIYQLAQNGKRLQMMGDDTWLPLFPNHFHKSYPFPSLNVKDLHTVDDGVIEHLLPALYDKDWDVLIAHFLGVDHAGHIFGVDSTPMLEKLDQYNEVLKEVVEILQNQSGPGGLHEHTFLLVIGDHGQTLNGDHGGGTAEEVETSLFAMSLKQLPPPISSIFDTSHCELDMDGRKMCISSVEQLDFAATVAALMGVPFPFGSIGHVNPELYALVANTWTDQGTTTITTTSKNAYCSNLELWMQQYAAVLCINSWQVKRYINQYSTSSIFGFPAEDLLQVENLYAQAQATWPNVTQKEVLLNEEMGNGTCQTKISILQAQIDAYKDFLEKVSELARSKWTQFDAMMMGIGLSILIVSLVIHLSFIKRARNQIWVIKGSNCGLIEKPHSNKVLSFMTVAVIFGLVLYAFSDQLMKSILVISAIFARNEQTFVYIVSWLVLLLAIGFLVLSWCNVGSGSDWNVDSEVNKKGSSSNHYSEKIRKECSTGEQGYSMKCMIALFLVAIRAFSLLSNSYILTEGSVARFLLATIGVLNLKEVLLEESTVLVAVSFLLLNVVLGFTGENGFSKDVTPASTSISVNVHVSDMGQFFWMLFTEVMPISVLAFLVFRSFQCTTVSSQWRILKYGFLPLVILSYILIPVYWVLESNVVAIPRITSFEKNLLPLVVYSVGFGLLLLLACCLVFERKEGTSKCTGDIHIAAITMLTAWGLVILMLLGRQGPRIALISILEGWCIIRSQKVAQKKEKLENTNNDMLYDPLPVTQWCFLAVSLFFCAGHRCTFDGLRYGAAFVGFDDFNIVRQGILLFVDTFGISHILPIFGLPLLVTFEGPYVHNKRGRAVFFSKLTQPLSRQYVC